VRCRVLVLGAWWRAPISDATSGDERVSRHGDADGRAPPREATARAVCAAVRGGLRRVTVSHPYLVPGVDAAAQRALVWRAVALVDAKAP
jgi:hypothetical protein